jgi:hypothetical protein
MLDWSLTRPLEKLKAAPPHVCGHPARHWSTIDGMFTKTRRATFLAATLAAVVSTFAQQAPTQPMTVTLLHLNDVYEIQPVEGGKSGGLARVATVAGASRTSWPPAWRTR